ncbi:AAA family ATPase [Herbaspirillum frisingense]|uniref:ABC-type cobalamin/Fe3+-siderophores transport system ATPase subunit n=1 Tax=Herbaspirillum frisingense TaxID=92645 RepID=A0ABU1PDD7_9BURK|nr:AAA family ATPase [Herbaspirillum frisingense]MDR6583517.1 ABC-type cobalamin/Fe3+-siderophores transport system ATPase subunit [Herbaspirillum frisingense]
MKVTVNQKHKSIPRGISFDLPAFCILTGKNGSGKSHLLEVISNVNASAVVEKGKQLTRIHYVSFNGLNPQVDDQCDQSQVISNVGTWWGQIQTMSQNYKAAINAGEAFSDVVKQFLPRYGHNPALFAVIERVLARSGKGLDQLTHDDVLANISFVDITQQNLFFSQCALIFKAYHTRQVKNDVAEFKASKGVPTVPYLTPGEFIEKYGPPPWDLINEILRRAELPYTVVDPQLTDFDLPYRLRLMDSSKNVEISVNDLSSGERVLMSLALAIYNTQEGGSKPELLLLDEPDAPLHPQFSSLLINTLIETIVKKAGVNVVVTTHSPSTVAMAPDSSVFEVDRETKIPRMVSNAHAVEILTAGMDFLKVSYENRKQVFVESKFDVQYFQGLYGIFSRRHQSTYQPVFLEPHTGTSNCTDVIDIVTKLRDSGSDLVFGVIDFDGVNSDTQFITVLGSGARYAIENYLLDPLYICFALIRYEKRSFADFGILTRHTYPEIASLTQQECQSMIDDLLTKIGLSLSDLVPTTLENGMCLNYPKSFLMHHGHSYETLIQTKFPELNAISKGQGDAALKLGLLHVVAEFPQFLPSELKKTFEKISGPFT